MLASLWGRRSNCNTRWC